MGPESQRLTDQSQFSEGRRDADSASAHSPPLPLHSFILKHISSQKLFIAVLELRIVRKRSDIKSPK